jgi:ATP-dependent helicase HrpB
VFALHGTLDFDAQDRAIAPASAGRRKVVLATSIAETSLTIEGVRVVIDSGLARVPRYEPDVGLTRLETVRVSRAAADQRRGRAGRTEPGVCYRLWEAPQTASLEPANRPEILAADLSGFVLDLAHWGVRDPAALDFLDPPPPAAVAEAKALLSELGAVDAQGRITQTGKDLRQLPLPPRLARMVVDAGAAGEAARAADIAVVLTERGLGGSDVDLAHRLEAFHRDRSQRAGEAHGMARRWAEMTRANADASPAELHVASAASRDASVGAILALAYPDRIAKNRGSEASFLLANGRGARLDAASPLAREPFLAVAEVAGSAAQGRIVLAAALSLTEIEAGQARRIETRAEMVFDSAAASLRARRVRRLGALTLAEQPMTIVPNEDSARLLAQGIARLGIERLPWTKGLRQWRDRVMFLRGAHGREPDAEDQEPDAERQEPDAERQEPDAEGRERNEDRERNNEWPDLSDAALAGASDWLVGLAAGKRALAEITSQELGDALAALLPWQLRRRLEVEAPTHFVAPSGSSVPIDYAAEAGPRLAIRVQELFGLDRHPTVAAGRAPLVLELLSPAHRPVQVTRDLPSFWRGSYAAVKAEMKGRYPRHPWPDDPLAAAPTRRAKPRGR